MSGGIAAALDVRAAGDKDAQGRFNLDNVHEGRPRYRKDESTTIKWHVDASDDVSDSSDGGGNAFWVLNSLGDDLYICRRDSATPPLTGWEAVAGAEPVPILTVCSSYRKRGAECVAAATQERVWKQRKFTDADIMCNTTRIPVHRATLCAASAVFEAAFSAPMREGLSAEYEINDVSALAVEAMLSHIYTGKVNVPAESLPELLELAVRFDLHSLVIEVSQAMLDGVTANSIRPRMQALRRHALYDPVFRFDGQWFYEDYFYELTGDGETLIFREIHAREVQPTGELSLENEWYTGKLFDQYNKLWGIIRLQRSGSGVLSNFRNREEEAWGDDIYATRPSVKQVYEKLCQIVKADASNELLGALF